MTDEQHIEHLKTHAPKIELTGREKVARNIGRLLLAVSLLLGAYSIVSVVHVAECINENLGIRQAPSQADAQAHIDYALSQQKLDKANTAVSKALSDAIAAKTQAEKNAAAAEFVAAFLGQRPVAAEVKAVTDKYVQTLEADQSTRAKHPLGKC